MRFFEFLESNSRYYKNESCMYLREPINKQTLRGDLRYYNSSDYAHSKGFEKSKAFVEQDKQIIVIVFSKREFKQQRIHLYEKPIVSKLKVLFA